MRLRHRWTSFVDLPRHRQKDQFIHLRNRIRRAQPVLGGRFYTHDYIHGENGWLGALFLGRRAPIFYNAMLRTTRYAYIEAVWDLAWDRSYELAPDLETDFFSRGYRDPKTKHWVIPAREPVLYRELDGLSRTAWIERQLPQLADARTLEVFEGWTLQRDYEYGIGVHATLAVPFLTIEAITEFIDRFLETEADYRDPQPIRYGYAEAAPWGLESNAIVEPWNWQRCTSGT